MRDRGVEQARLARSHLLTNPTHTRRLVGDLRAKHHRKTREGVELELRDAAHAHAAQDLAANLEVGLAIVTEPQHDLRAARHAVIFETDHEPADQAGKVREPEFAFEVSISEAYNAIVALQHVELY